MKDLNLSLDRHDFVSVLDPVIHNIFVVVTATDSEHYPGAFSLLASVHRYVPHIWTIVYDLGMSQEQRKELSAACNVQVRDFDFHKYPPHVQILGYYSWKPLMIHVSNLCRTTVLKINILCQDQGVYLHVYTKLQYIIIRRLPVCY